MYGPGRDCTSLRFLSQIQQCFVSLVVVSLNQRHYSPAHRTGYTPVLRSVAEECFEEIGERVWLIYVGQTIQTSGLAPRPADKDILLLAFRSVRRRAVRQAVEVGTESRYCLRCVSRHWTTEQRTFTFCLPNALTFCVGCRIHLPK